MAKETEVTVRMRAGCAGDAAAPTEEAAEAGVTTVGVVAVTWRGTLGVTPCIWRNWRQRSALTGSLPSAKERTYCISSTRASLAAAM